MTTFNSKKSIRKAINGLLKSDLGADAEEYGRVQKIFQTFRNNTGPGKLLPTEESWREVINMCKDTTTGVSIFHRFTFVAMKKWDHETRLLLAFFLAFGGDPEIPIGGGVTKDNKKLEKMKMFIGKSAIEVCSHEVVKKMYIKWVESKDDTVKRAGILRSLAKRKIESFADAVTKYATKIRKKYMDPDGIKDIHLDAKSIESEVNEYLDWRKRESFGLAQKLDVVSELSTKDPYGRHLIHTILYRELLNKEMVKWIHDKISSTSEIERVLKDWTKARTAMEFELRQKIHALLPKSWTGEHILMDLNKENVALLDVSGIGRTPWQIAEFIDRKPHAHKSSIWSFSSYGVENCVPLELAVKKRQKRTGKLLLRYHANPMRISEKYQETARKWLKNVEDEEDSKHDEASELGGDDTQNSIVTVDAEGTPDVDDGAKVSKSTSRKSINKAALEEEPVVPPPKNDTEMQESNPEWNERSKPIL